MDGRWIVAVGALTLAGACGAVVLRRSWRRPSGDAALVIAGWTMCVGVVAAAMLALGVALGLFAAAIVLPLGALFVVGQGAVRRAARVPRAGELAPEPLQGPSRAWRGVLKFLLAGPLGMLAAMGVAFCYASWAPGAITTRLLIAALLVPLLWGLAMTWTLADQRLIRATGVLVGTIAAGFGLALLGGIA